jgi:hypothetical protein
MTVELNRGRIFIRSGYTDLRKAVNDTAIITPETGGPPSERECGTDGRDADVGDGGAGEGEPTDQLYVAGPRGPPGQKAL